MIPQFYSQQYVQEIDRRYGAMYGKSLADMFRTNSVNAELYVSLTKKSWGQPRKSWQKGLGPIDAWKSVGLTVSEKRRFGASSKSADRCWANSIGRPDTIRAIGNCRFHRRAPIRP